MNAFKFTLLVFFALFKVEIIECLLVMLADGSDDASLRNEDDLREVHYSLNCNLQIFLHLAYQICNEPIFA